MRQTTLTGLTILAAALALPAVAQEEAPRYDQVDLAATAEREIENDLLIAVVYAEVEDSDQADAADRVNTDIAWAANLARMSGNVELQTMQYSTRPVYANGRRIVGWVARQSLRLESTDAATLSELLGQLQERVAVQSINYGLSEEARIAAEEALIGEAIANFTRRANLIADQLDRDGFRIVRLNVSTQGMPMPFEMQMMRAAAADSVAAPEIEAGVQTVTVMVNGTVELDSGR